jgi:hypothetical protein
MEARMKLDVRMAVISAAFATTAGFAVAAVCTTEVVTEADVVRQPENTPPTSDWVLYTRAVTSSGTFVAGPEQPPAGNGSLALRTPTAADKVTLFNYDHVGTLLASIDAIGYSTYRDPASTATVNQVPSINIQIDYNGSAPGGFSTLVFEPVYNTAQGPIVPGEWQTWDAYDGGQAIWWSTRPMPGGVCAFDCFVTWETIVANNPDAVILGGFGVNQGSGNGGLIAATDALTLGANGSCVTYDFEVFRVATTKDDCKDGGWQAARRGDGSAFKNQGDCIQYVNTGR